MKEKGEHTAEKEADVFYKDSLLRSKRYSERKDALKALLKQDVPYTLEQVDKILNDFMKGQVK